MRQRRYLLLLCRLLFWGVSLMICVLVAITLWWHAPPQTTQTIVIDPNQSEIPHQNLDATFDQLLLDYNDLIINKKKHQWIISLTLPSEQQWLDFIDRLDRLLRANQQLKRLDECRFSAMNSSIVSSCQFSNQPVSSR